MPVPATLDFRHPLDLVMPMLNSYQDSSCVSVKDDFLPHMIAALLVSLLMAAASGADSNWPQFRGPGNAGGITGGHLPERW
jgi:hypothetical protein